MLKSFIGAVLAGMMFLYGVWAMYGQTEYPAISVEHPYIVSTPYTGTADLAMVKGEQVLGMIPAALSGAYTLTIDGLPIREHSDISQLSFVGVPEVDYKITVTRDEQGAILAVKASR